jgi:hypothetical protein
MVLAPRIGIGLGQLDALALEMVNLADMSAVGSDHFHMLANLGRICHG